MRLAKVIAMLLLIVVALVLWRLRADPAARVARRFDELAALISADQQETPVQIAVKAQELKDFFTNPAELRTPVMGLSGALPPADIASHTMLARAMFTAIRFRFQDLQIAFSAPDTAAVSVTALLDGTLAAGDRVSEIRELRCELRRSERTWRFSACEVVEVLQR